MSVCLFACASRCLVEWAIMVCVISCCHMLFACVPELPVRLRRRHTFFILKKTIVYIAHCHLLKQFVLPYFRSKKLFTLLSTTIAWLISPHYI
jgi:hypothetical protein